MKKASAILLLFCFCLSGTTAGLGAEPRGAEILNTQSYWRWYVTLRKPYAPTKPGGVPVLLAISRGIRTSAHVDHLHSAAPPAGWEKPGLDDGDWPRSRAAWLRELAFGRYSSAMACLRGKFTVTDPNATARLALTLKYRGGVVVYLNGTEVARAHLPRGELTPDTAAEVYPRDVYVGPKGRPLPDYWNRRHLPANVQQDMVARMARRERTLGPVTLPTRLLRKGTNVLAVSVHRAAYSPAAHLCFTPVGLGTRSAWIPIDLSAVKLVATGRGVVPNVARPKGFQVWNHDRNDRVTVGDYGDPAEPLRPVRIAAARNGAWCGQVVAGSTKPIRALKVAPSDLTAVKGAGAISASEVTVLYGRMNWGGRHGPRWCDALSEDAPTDVAANKKYGGAVVPVVARVHVPRDAAPGEYRGSLTVSVAGARPIAVPVGLTVYDWIVPHPWKFRTYMGIYQSPRSVALQYKVKEWSEEHWKLLEKSFELLGRVGNKMVNITVIDQTQFGNDEGMVYWIRRPDGSHDYDFSVFDRYLALAVKHCGKLDYVVLHVWHSGGWETRKPSQKNTVTVVERTTGRRERMQVPVFGSEQSKRFWKPVLDAAHQRLKKLGMENALTLGILSDGTAAPPVFRAFQEITPGGAKWMRGLHSATRSTAPYPLKGGGVVTLHEHCYGMSMVSPERPVPPIWNLRGQPGTAYYRVAPYETRVSLIGYRIMAEQALFTLKQGVGRICLDFWPVVKGRHRGLRNLYNFYPHSSCAQRAPALYQLAWPGPDGPETTVRYEAVIEGLQEAEAMIAVSEAVDKHARKLGPELVRECRDVLRERLRYCHIRNQSRWQRVYFHMNHYGWQDLARRLLNCAARVSKKAGR